jgi:hypothetical protein
VVRKELERLLQGKNCLGAEVVSRLVVGSQPIHAHLPLMSLPLVLVLGSYDPSAMAQPYLSAEGPSPRSEAIAQAKGLKIGLVWAGNPQQKGDRQRSMALSDLAALETGGATFFSLQMGFAADQMNNPPFPIVDATKQIRDFADTAALVAELDLIITVDTSVAHLAGAMGKETWIPLRFDSDWRYMLEPNRTPWYPSFRIYRQAQSGDWQSPVERIKHDLTQLIQKR